jgi:3alpha(or 20beta)-hydroxysteroid dehydrogenase
MPGRLEGQVILVTGAAGGIGRGVVNRLLEEGAKIAATDLRPADPPLPASNNLRFSTQDVSDEQSWRDTIAAVVEWGGRLDGLVNNAAIMHEHLLSEIDIEVLDQLYAANQRGTVLGIKHAAQAMKQTGGGAIVNFSSLAGLRGFPTTGGYSATKWAVRGVTKVAAAELGRDRIRVNSVHPGAVDTPMLTDGMRANEGVIPLGRIGTPADIAGVVTFLLSDDAAYVTGAEIAVDGGIGL